MTIKPLLYIFTAIVFLTTGCATTTGSVKPSARIPAVLTKPTPLATPPSKEEYMKSSLAQREDLLTNYANAMAKQLGLCNADKSSIGDLVKAIDEIYKKD